MRTCWIISTRAKRYDSKILLIKFYQKYKYFFEHYFSLSNFFKAYLKSSFSVLKSLLNISSFATKIYFPVANLFSYFKVNALKSLFALFLYTAFPTFFDAIKAMFNLSLEIKKATNDFVCHRLLLL